ncbi:hypothetical protein ACQKCU_19155 [Heyndrickxia sporothermodurans]
MSKNYIFQSLIELNFIKPEKLDEFEILVNPGEIMDGFIQGSGK